ncbi:MAG: AsmA family protein [Alphaproteobacteria bacterium]|nr:AsmA family protein [Alphaproteobacteria bacterium]
MKKFLKFLVVVLLLPVVIFGGAIGFLKFADLNKYKPQIEELVQKYAQTKIKINGDLDVGVSLKPSIELNNVTVYVPQNNEQKLAEIGNAMVQISILPLFDKEIVIDMLQTSNTTIFYGEADSLLIKNLTADMDDYDSPINLNVETTIAGTDIAGEGKISSLRNLKQSEFNNINTDISVTAMGYLLYFDGSVKGLNDSLAISGSYELSRKNTTLSGNADIDLGGEIPNIKANVNSNLIKASDFIENKTASNSLFITSAHAEDFVKGTEIPYEYLKMADADITFDVKKVEIDNKTTVQNIKGGATLTDGVLKINVKSAETKGIKVNGSVSIDSPKSLPYAKINIKSDKINIGELIGVKADKKASLDWLIGSAYASTLMTNTQIPYQYLKMANADIAADIKKIDINEDVSVSDVLAYVNLKSGLLKTNIQSLKAGNGSLTGTISVNASDKTASVDLKGKDIILQDLYKPYGQVNNPALYIKSGGKTNLLINVTTSGKDTDQYLSNLTGQVIALVDNSVVNIKSLDRLKGNILVQILDNLKINVTKSDMKLACAVVRTNINKGLMNFPKGIAFNAKDFYLVANGKVNLSDEKINLEIQPFSGKITDTNISSLIGGLLKIKGTISQPKVALNQEATAKNVIAAIASGGTYNLGDMMLSADRSPCRTALAGTTYADYFKNNAPVRNAISGSYTGAKDSVKNVGKEIKNQAKEIKNTIKGLFK